MKYYVTPRRSPPRSLSNPLAVAAILVLSYALTGCAEQEIARGAAAEAMAGQVVVSATSASAATTPQEGAMTPAVAPAMTAPAEQAEPDAAPESVEAAQGSTLPPANPAKAAAPPADVGSADVGSADAGSAMSPNGSAASGSMDTTAVAAPEPDRPAPSRRHRAGEDPEFAERMGWPVTGPAPLPGALLPHNRIIAYYGNPLSRRMGVLGEYDSDEMLARLDQVVAEWEEADPETPVIPALHLVAVVAQADSGTYGKYRLRMRDSLVERVAEWAETRDALVFLDIQVGLSTLEEELPRLLPFLRRPNFHLGIDPEFSMKDGTPPGRRIGTFDAADINYATELLAGWVREYDLPPKVLVVHRFTSRMVTNSAEIMLRPEVQIVMHMDGWGAAWLKRDSYRDFIVREPVQFAGFKIFYHNDVREEGWTLMSPAEVLRLRPAPVYIQYQ